MHLTRSGYLNPNRIQLHMYCWIQPFWEVTRIWTVHYLHMCRNELVNNKLQLESWLMQCTPAFVLFFGKISIWYTVKLNSYPHFHAATCMQMDMVSTNRNKKAYGYDLYFSNPSPSDKRRIFKFQNNTNTYVQLNSAIQGRNSYLKNFNICICVNNELVFNKMHLEPWLMQCPPAFAPIFGLDNYLIYFQSKLVPGLSRWYIYAYEYGL